MEIELPKPDEEVEETGVILNVNSLRKCLLPQSKIVRTWKMNENDDDLALVRRALSGEEQAATIIYSLRPQLVTHLTSKGAPRGSISEDAVADFLGDCFGARERSHRATTNRLLEMYKGNGPLIAWLKKSCWNYFLDSTKGDRTVPFPGSGEEDVGADLNPVPVSAEPEVIARIVAALEYAFSEIDPLTLIFLRLVYLEGVSQSDVATVFDCDNSTVSRRLDQGLAALRTKAESFQKRKTDSLQIEWPDLLAICQSPPGFIYEN
jgi:DNA-directed RNA polymerase specialized sigma24 family protein